MVPPIWVDEHRRRRPTRPCSRCGTETPIYRLPIADIRRVGWQLFTPASYTGACGHAQEIVPVPESESSCWLVPVVGEAG